MNTANTVGKITLIDLCHSEVATNLQFGKENKRRKKAIPARCNKMKYGYNFLSLYFLLLEFSYLVLLFSRSSLTWLHQYHIFPLDCKIILE